MHDRNLEAIRVPMKDEARAQWRERYGVTSIFLNDIAAGALVEVLQGWGKEDAPTKVSNGLRHLLQELWLVDLARPVVAVFWPGPKAKKDAVDALDRLTWDQEQHRGDFALRRAKDEASAKELLWALLGDTMGDLDDVAQKDRVGVAQVHDALKERLETPNTSMDQPWTEPSVRLVESLIDELERAVRTRTEPDLVGRLHAWLRSEEVLP